MDTDISTVIKMDIGFHAEIEIPAGWFNGVDTELKGLREYAAGTKTLKELGLGPDITSGRALYLAASEDTLELAKRIMAMALREHLPLILKGEADFKKVANVRIDYK